MLCRPSSGDFSGPKNRIRKCLIFWRDPRMRIFKRMKAGGLETRGLEKRLKPRLRPAQDQGVDVVGALIGIDGFQIGHVTDDIEFF